MGGRSDGSAAKAPRPPIRTIAKINHRLNMAEP